MELTSEQINEIYNYDSDVLRLSDISNIYTLISKKHKKEVSIKNLSNLHTLKIMMTNKANIFGGFNNLNSIYFESVNNIFMYKQIFSKLKSIELLNVNNVASISGDFFPQLESLKIENCIFRNNYFSMNGNFSNLITLKIVKSQIDTLHLLFEPKRLIFLNLSVNDLIETVVGSPLRDIKYIFLNGNILDRLYMDIDFKTNNENFGNEKILIKIDDISKLPCNIHKYLDNYNNIIVRN